MLHKAYETHFEIQIALCISQIPGLGSSVTVCPSGETHLDERISYKFKQDWFPLDFLITFSQRHTLQPNDSQQPCRMMQQASTALLCPPAT